MAALYPTGVNMRFKEVRQLKESFTVSEPNGLRGPAVADVQKALKALGFSVGPMGVDGILGPYTEKGIKDFQELVKMPITGHPDKETVDHINRTLQANPTVAAGLTPSTDADVKGRRSGANVDTSTIQDPDFNRKLEKIARELGVKTSDLLAVMKQESGVNPQARNNKSGATGLIQFMPKTAQRLGTSTEELFKMDGVQQLDYVYKYFKMTGVGNGDLGDLYMAVFMPKYVGYPNETVLGQNGAPGFSGKVYAQNKGLDRNRDGAITVADVKQSVARFA